LQDHCLAYPNSDLWRFLDRQMFERVMSRDTPAKERRSRLMGLYDAVTLFYYFHPAVRAWVPQGREHHQRQLGGR
jgi:hypothetical protein